jgi:hypothetical protein
LDVTGSIMHYIQSFPGGWVYKKKKKVLPSPGGVNVWREAEKTRGTL